MKRMCLLSSLLASSNCPLQMQAHWRWAAMPWWAWRSASTGPLWAGVWARLSAPTTATDVARSTTSLLSVNYYVRTTRSMTRRRSTCLSLIGGYGKEWVLVQDESAEEDAPAAASDDK